MNKLLIFLFLIFTSLGLTELLLRVYGKKPNIYSAEDVKITCSPSPLFVPDSILGYNYALGDKNITLNHALVYTLSIDKQQLRINPFVTDSKNKIAIFGSSFFAGMGVDDEEVVSAQLQLLLLENKGDVINYSIPGHGMTTEVKRLIDLCADNDTIDYAIFEVASFHLERNAGAYLFVKNFSKFNDVPMNYLIAELLEYGLDFKLMDVSKKISFLETKSALIYEIKKITKKHEFPDGYLLNLEKALIDRAYSQCKKNGIEAVFMLISHDQMSDDIKAYLMEKKYPFVESKVDHNLDKYNLNPYDQHPNAYAHKVYAEEIFNFISNPDAK